MNGNRIIRNWLVSPQERKQHYDAILARDSFLRIFAFFTTVSDDAVDVSALRVRIAGYILDDPKRPTFATEGMRTSIVLGIKRTDAFIDGKRVYTIRTNGGSYYNLLWEERSQWQWDELVRISRSHVVSYSAPPDYRTAFGVDEIPKISEDVGSTTTYSITQIVQTKRS